MAKASLPDLSEREKRADYGLILRRAQQILGLTRKEMAVRLKVDEGQLGRWYSGDENQQTWRYFSDLAVRAALRIAEAEGAEGVVIRTVIEMERKVG